MLQDSGESVSWFIILHWYEKFRQCKRSSDALHRTDNKDFTLYISLLGGSNTDK